MKSFIKNIIKKILVASGLNYKNYIVLLNQITGISKANQILLMTRYRELFEKKIRLPFEDIDLRFFSQNGEDGILLYIYSLVGMSNRKSVEICAGDGIVCNTANLIINHGFEGLLFDGSKKNIEIGRAFYSENPDTSVYPPKLETAWITRENVNQLLLDNGFSGEIDLLSLDLDGMDYWIWEEIDCINPRIVVLEYNNLCGPDKAVTVPYLKNFVAERNKYGCDYAGASLSAFVKLGKKKGYRLIGCQRYGFNAFFLRNDIGKDIFPEISPSECFDHPHAKYAMEVRAKNIIHREWIEV